MNYSVCSYSFHRTFAAGGMDNEGELQGGDEYEIVTKTLALIKRELGEA